MGHLEKIKPVATGKTHQRGSIGVTSESRGPTAEAPVVAAYPGKHPSLEEINKLGTVNGQCRHRRKSESSDNQERNASKMKIFPTSHRQAHTALLTNSTKYGEVPPTIHK